MRVKIDESLRELKPTLCLAWAKMGDKRGTLVLYQGETRYYPLLFLRKMLCVYMNKELSVHWIWASGYLWTGSHKSAWRQEQVLHWRTCDVWMRRHHGQDQSKGNAAISSWEQYLPPCQLSVPSELPWNWAMPNHLCSQKQQWFPLVAFSPGHNLATWFPMGFSPSLPQFHYCFFPHQQWRVRKLLTTPCPVGIGS